MCAIASPSALAQDDDAQALVRQGVELRRAHRNQLALEAFERAMQLSPTPAVQAQVALAEQALGKWLDAARDLEAGPAQGDGPWIAKNRAAPEEARAVVEEHLAYLTVDVDVATAQIELGGVALPRGAEQRVLAGPGTLVTRATGYAPDVHDIGLAPKEHAHLTIALVPFAPPPPPPAPAPAPAPTVGAPAAAPAEPPHGPVHHATSNAGPIVLGVIGVAGLATGTFFGLRTIQEKDERNAQCVGGCTQAAVTFDSQARTSAAVSTIAFGAGLAAVAGGVTWWVVAHQKGPTVSVLLGPGTAGVTIGGTL